MTFLKFALEDTWKMILTPGWICLASWTQCHSLLWRKAGGERGWENNGGKNEVDDDDDDDGNDGNVDNVLWR